MAGSRSLRPLPGRGLQPHLHAGTVFCRLYSSILGQTPALVPNAQIFHGPLTTFTARAAPPCFIRERSKRTSSVMPCSRPPPARRQEHNRYVYHYGEATRPDATTRVLRCGVLLHRAGLNVPGSSYDQEMAVTERAAANLAANCRPYPSQALTTPLHYEPRHLRTGAPRS